MVKSIRYLKSRVKTRSTKWGCFLGMISSLWTKLAQKNKHFHYKSSFWTNLPNSGGIFFSRDLWIITKFGIAITEICCGVTEGFILPQFCMTLNQGVTNSKNGYFCCFCCYLRIYRLSNPSFLFSSLQTLKCNLFLLPGRKFDHS